MDNHPSTIDVIHKRRTFLKTDIDLVWRAKEHALSEHPQRRQGEALRRNLESQGKYKQWLEFTSTGLIHVDWLKDYINGPADDSPLDVLAADLYQHPPTFGGCTGLHSKDHNLTASQPFVKLLFNAPDVPGEVPPHRNFILRVLIYQILNSRLYNDLIEAANDLDRLVQTCDGPGLEELARHILKTRLTLKNMADVTVFVVLHGLAKWKNEDEVADVLRFWKELCAVEGEWGCGNRIKVVVTGLPEETVGGAEKVRIMDLSEVSFGV